MIIGCLDEIICLVDVRAEHRYSVLRCSMRDCSRSSLRSIAKQEGMTLPNPLLSVHICRFLHLVLENNSTWLLGMLLSNS